MFLTCDVLCPIKQDRFCTSDIQSGKSSLYGVFDAGKAVGADDENVFDVPVQVQG